MLKVQSTWLFTHRWRDNSFVFISEMRYHIHYLHISDYCPNLCCHVNHNVSAVVLSGLLQVVGMSNLGRYFAHQGRMFLLHEPCLMDICYQLYPANFPSESSPLCHVFLRTHGAVDITFLFMIFLSVLTLCHMQTAPSRNWMRFTVSISYDDSHNITCSSIYIYIYIYIQGLVQQLIKVKSKVGNRCREWPEGSLFNTYNIEVRGRALLLSLHCSILPLIPTL